MNSELKELICSRSALELEDQRDAVGREVRRITEDAASRGALHSSGRVVMVRDVLARETRVRAALVWNTCARGLGVAGVPLSMDLASEIKALVREVVRDGSEDLVEHLSKANQGIQLSGPLTDVEALFSAAFERIDSEVDFAVLGARGTSEGSGSATINIYQSQGIVQTGAGSSANLTIQLHAEEKEQISVALTAIVDAIEQDLSLGPQERSQALEVARDAQSEVQQDSPNRLRLRGALSGLASTVQTLASAPQAYQLLKGAAALLGLQLP